MASLDELKGSQNSQSRSSSETSPSNRSSDSSTLSEHDDFGFPTSPTVSGASHPSFAGEVMTKESAITRDPSFEVDWDDDDPDNPLNWSIWFKSHIIFSLSFSTLLTVLYSTSYTSGISAIQEEFHVPSETIVTLGMTFYLLGLAFGVLFMAPLSETYGRKPVFVVSMIFFTLFTIPAAKATSMTEIIVVRFLGALAGSSMIASAPGTVGEIVTAEHRPLAFSIWSIGPFNGPVVGPLIGGFITEGLGWRWANWLVLILGGFTILLMLSIKETYPPVLLQRKAAALRKTTGDSRYWSRYDQRLQFWALMKLNLSRPFIMAVKEPICIFWNIYIGIIYGVLYLCFVAYPFVFQGVRHWGLGPTGLSFLGIGIGSLITIAAEPLIRRMINAHAHEPGTSKPPPEAAMSVVCIAAILCPVGEFIFAWTCAPATIHWSLPIAAGIPFGAGNTAVFIYATNYLVTSYGVFAASAMASNSMVRSAMGGLLPLAGAPLYRALGPNWAGTLLGGLQILFLPIPFVFYRYGAKIRARSGLIRRMREDQERAERKREKFRGRQVGEEKGVGGANGCEKMEA